jgi:hypothetical protein
MPRVMQQTVRNWLGTGPWTTCSYVLLEKRGVVRNGERTLELQKSLSAGICMYVHRHGLYFNHCSCRAHSISHFRDHDAPNYREISSCGPVIGLTSSAPNLSIGRNVVVRDPVIRRESFTHRSPSIYMTDCECRETIATVQLSATADHSRTVGALFTSVHKLGVGQSFKITNDQATVLGIKQLSLHHGDRKAIDAHFHGPQTLGRRFPHPIVPQPCTNDYPKGPPFLIDVRP